MNIFRLMPALVFVLLSCQNKDSADSSYTAFTGASIIDGSGSDPIQNGLLLLQHGRVVAIGKADEVEIPEGAVVWDVSGKTIMPGIINGHGHVGDVKGIEGGHYSTENLMDNLSLYAAYGVTTVVSLGGDQKEAVPLRA